MVNRENFFSPTAGVKFQFECLILERFHLRNLNKRLLEKDP